MTQWHYTSVSDGSFSIHRGPSNIGPDPIAHDIPSRTIATLMCAAPDLKSAAEEALDQMEQCEKMFRDDLEFNQAMRSLRAAIAKAGAP